MSEGNARTLVIGTGALACAFGARLARAGTPVTLAGTWRAGLRTCGGRGIRVHEDGGSWTARVNTTSLGERVDAVDLVLVLVKSRRTESVAPLAARAVSPSGLVVTLQNGLGNREILERHAGAGRVATGIALLGATLLGPGEVRFFPGRVVLGLEPGTRAAVRLVAERFRAAGIDVDLEARVECHVWRKLAANCAINPLTALAGVPNGALLERPEWREELRAAAREVGMVAQAKGIDLGASAEALAEEVAAATAANRSSMLQDLARGAVTEIDALNGAVVAEGRRLGVSTPVNAELWRRVRGVEGRHSGREASRSAERDGGGAA